MKPSVFLLSLMFLCGVSGVLHGASKTQTPKKSRSSAAAAPALAQPSLLAADGSPAPFRSQVLEGFKKLYERGVWEKLYLMTDKPYYSAGEYIWFKGFLVNGATLTWASATNFIYVELIDGAGALKQRVKIKADDFGFHNALKLPPDLPEGEYVLRAYTRWMMNDDPGFFFTRRIRVANPLDDQVLSTIDYARNADGTIRATVRLTDSRLNPVKHQLLDGTRIFSVGHDRPFGARTDDNGVAHFDFAPPADSVRGSIRIKTPNNDKITFDRTFRLPMFSPDFDVQFFPEGGQLLSGQLQQVAFKAIGTNGLGMDVSGKVFASGGELITEFSSQHLGMGEFSLRAAPGERYYAEMTSPSGLTKRFDLPAVATTGCAIHVARQGGRLMCRIAATSDIDPGRLGLVAHAKGRLVFAEELGAGQLLKTINTDQLPEGILVITIVDRQTGASLSERLCFVWHGTQAQGAVYAAGNVSGRRTPVTLTLHVTGSDGQPAAGSFAMSVTDRNAVVRDSLDNNIISALLLTQDIKGYVENPGYYFLDRSAERASQLDLLMMTQGWRRFDISEVLRGQLKPPAYTKEAEQSVEGEVRGFFGNMAKNANLIFAIPQKKYFDFISLNKGSHFNLTGLDFPDSTLLYLQAVKSAGRTGSTLSLNMKDEVFPATNVFVPRLSLGDMPTPLPDAFLGQAKDQYFYQGGMSLINLRALTVPAARVEDRLPPELRMNTLDTYSVSAERLKELGTASFRQVVTSLPGVHMGLLNPKSDNYDLVPFKGRQPLPIYVDSFEYEFYEVANYGADQIATCALLRNVSGGYAIFVQLKDEVYYPSSPSIAKIQPLGYKPPVAFYQPKYEVAEVRNGATPDLRTTIFWAPEIRTDSTGVAQVTFFTADPAVPYEVVLEGVTDAGELCRTVTTLERKQQ